MSRPLLPTRARPARLQPLTTLPVFLDLARQRVLVAGGGDAVAWKAELLAAAGARVTVLHPDPGPELAALVEAKAGAIELQRRPWREADLDGAALAVAEAEEDGEAARFAAAARSRGVLVNVIDRPAFCDFQFGAIVNRSPVVIGISTDGAAPVLAQAIRRRIEAVLPRSLGAWSALAKGFRERLAATLPGKADRRRFWEKFVDVTFISQNEEDAQLAEIERLARETLAETTPTPSVGTVVIVGAGPGDPELLTLRAMRELQAADVILHDRLVTPQVLELARREARRIAVGKEGHGPACRQEDINALILSLAHKGKRVVRLKGGDPSIFGRAGEEIAACRAAGVPVIMVPGVTAATAAAAALNLSLTHREVSRRVQFVTGHDRDGALPPDLDLSALADPRATTCVYMGRRTAAELARRLIAEGLSPRTPAVALSNVSRQNQEARATSLGALARGPALPDAPMILLIGQALDQARLACGDEPAASASPAGPAVLAA